MKAENMSSTAENSTANTGNTIPQLQEQQGQQEQATHERVVLPSTQGGTSKSKVRGKRKYWVWNHFDKIECKDNSDQRATCKYCEKSLACPISSGTSCLSNHLNRCKKYHANVEKSQRTLTFKPLASGNFGGTTHALASWKFDQEECRGCLAKMIITDEIPFRFVKHEGLHQFCRAMQPLFVMPSHFTVARYCYELYKQEKLNFMKYLKKLSLRVCLTTDVWTSIQNLSYMCITCHFIDDHRTLYKKNVKFLSIFCQILGHSGEVIGKAIEKCLLDWRTRRVFTVIVDNASSNDLCIQYLKRRLNSWEVTDPKYVSELFNKNGLPDSSDWEYAKNLLPFLEVFYETTLKLSGSLYVTGNEYIRQIYGLGLMISSWCESGDLCLKAMATRRKRKYDKYWANINNVIIMLFVVVLLDPRFKLESVDIIIDKSYDAQNAKMLKEKLRKVLSSMYDSYDASIVSSTVVQASEQAQGEKNDAKPKAGTDYIRKILKKQKKSSKKPRAESGYFKHLPLEPINIDVVLRSLRKNKKKLKPQVDIRSAYRSP
ncbi:zinc finger BED domain-containing protein RICESLEEPER 1-like [Canna indica]|uniref:Zinc finger BED domain-containing protein RICESLEEPER 1-like n=1 Tax=Canna indica TaxID=4628 RepID=A0AAQ3KWJ8_9LILI|nr:zinc finger BED domain-containing protein RICESLEEPER 1-like [Canna indica]